MNPTRPISWVKAARKDFEAFPEDAQHQCLTALTIAAAGGKADIAKPMQGLGSGVLEIALRFRGDAYRVMPIPIGPVAPKKSPPEQRCSRSASEAEADTLAR